MKSSIAHIVLTLTLLLVLSACQQERPEFLIEEDMMVMVLRDMHIAHAGVDQTTQNVGERPSKYREFNRVILDSYELDREEFYETYSYYQYRPELMDSLYVRVIEELNVELAPLQQRERPKQKNPIAQ